MLDLTKHGLLPLIQNVEYAMLLIYILYKIQLSPLKLRSYLASSFLFCLFVALLCMVRIIRNTLLLLEECEESEVLLNSAGFAVYFTIFSLIAKCWHVKYIKNSFSIPCEEKSRLSKRAGLYFLYANIFIYSVLCVLYILLLQEIFSDSTRRQIALYIYIFRIIGKLILTFGLISGGIRLLKTVNNISIIKPTKLKLYVYLIIAISVWTTLSLIIFTILYFENRLYPTNPNV